MTIVAPVRPVPAPTAAVPEQPVFLDPSGRRQRLLEHALVVLLAAALLLLGTAGYALL